MSMHYSISGKGETIVFVHGAYINSTFWEHQISTFEQHFQILNVDLPSHGHSAPADVEEYSVDWYSDTLIELLDELEIENFSIVGLSLGAMIAQNIAAKQPERTRSIILLGGSVSMQLTWLEKMVLSVLFPKPVAMYLFGLLSTKQFLKVSFFLTWFMRGNKWLGKMETRQRIRESIRRISRPEIKKIYASVHGFRKQDLESGDYPVLMINGQYDSPLIHYHSKYQKKRLKERATYLIVPGTGHGCNFDKPELFNRMVIDWLNENGIKSKAEIASDATTGKGYTSEYNKPHETHRAS